MKKGKNVRRELSNPMAMNVPYKFFCVNPHVLRAANYLQVSQSIVKRVLSVAVFYVRITEYFDRFWLAVSALQRVVISAKGFRKSWQQTSLYAAYHGFMSITFFRDKRIAIFIPAFVMRSATQGGLN